MDVDEGRVTYSKSGRVKSLLTADDLGPGGGNSAAQLTDVQNRLRDFIILFRTGGEYSYVYLEALKDNIHLGRNYLEIDLEDFKAFERGAPFQYGDLIREHPSRWLPVFEAAAQEAARKHDMFGQLDSHEIQIQLYWKTKPCLIRDIKSINMGKLCAVPGIVVKCSETKQKVIHAVLQCTSCKSEIKQDIPASLASPQLPSYCQANTNTDSGAKCRPNPYIIRPDRCRYINVQYIKLQELPEDVPTGELPRHVDLQVDRELVAKVRPGQRLFAVGISSIFNDAVKERGRKAAGVRRRYLKGVGLMLFSPDGTPTSVNANFSALRPSGTLLWNTKQEKEFKELAASPTLYEDLANSLAPSIYGHENIKKACIAQLFGGTRKKLTDGGRLRGDMNILLIGDPSTAKSQLLKAVYGVSPIGVYTSGKGSSAAGLTATVGREPQSNGKGGGFYLEGGSMVLADGGIVCIDEFDKMREQDTVAIHEAMEQQTISVAKAGLSTVLNSRTSVLAAANPSMGCYDPLKSNEEQMNFKATIVSRFDLIFKVLDPPDREKDARIATHVVGLHRGGTHGTQVEGKIPRSVLKTFVAYCRAQIITKLGADAEQRLKDFYVETRKSAFAVQKNSDKSIIKITVRQLESLVRLTEALAKMRCQTQATAADAEEAIRLYKISTVDAINSGVIETALDSMQEEAIVDLEHKIESKVPIGTQVSTVTLVATLSALGYEEDIIQRALLVMSKRGILKYKSHKRYITRQQSAIS